ncbi:hypothetical protein Cni_G28945 [Canna indica]|uniref:Serine aminopeptidase S33 domain-containing protein n=1 Tax=Canna indica TaxID=4628 RepID=A0AAQ3QT00_9LILI|nr:hypothetical protein Cni_G28945 [Canna indica]
MICIRARASAARNPRHRPEEDNGKPSTSCSSRATEMEATVKPAGPSRSLVATRGTEGRVLAVLSLLALRGVLLLLNGFLLLLLLPFQRRTAPVPVEAEEEENGGRGKAVVARRVLAIEKVREVSAEEDEVGGSVREFAMFQTARGEALFTRSWTHRSLQPRGLVVILHGLNEHSGRYDHFAKQLNGSGFKVYAMDWIGHGGSDGLHGYVHSLDHAVDDLKRFLEKAILENPGLPRFIFAHSTGAAIVLKAALDPKIEALIQGVVLTSPAVHVEPSHPLIAVNFFPAIFISVS